MKYTRACVVFVLAATLACTVYADLTNDWRIDPEVQTNAWNGENSQNSLPLREKPLYYIRTRDKRQTSPGGSPALMQNFLYFANERFLVHINRNGSGLQTFTLSNNSIAVAVDFDVRLGYMFWSDVSHDIIAAARMNGTGLTILVNSSINVPDGLAWDWVNKKLYWTDAADKDIEVIDPLNFHRKLLISTGNTTIPRAIVVDPQNRRMYWTDWGTVAKIERASMDGTSREVLHNTNLVWPNSLTLDYDTQILYWMDGQLDKFESSNADGSNRRLLSTTHIYHPFGITLYQNRFYWTDWHLNAVLTAPMNLSAAVSVVISGLQSRPMGISVVSVDRQPEAVNPCATNNGGCSHLCLLSTGSGGHTCVCPDGHAYGNCTAPPKQPRNVRSINTTSRSISLVWEQPFNNSAFITGYRVRYQQPAFLDANSGVKVVNVTAKMADINGLHPGVTYNFTVVAFNEIVDGTPSDIASVTTLEEAPAAAPGNLTVVNISANELNVSWERPNERDINGILRYYILKYYTVNLNGNTISTNISGNTHSKILRGLNNFTSYNVSVAAFTIDAGPFSTEVETTSENVPGESPRNVCGQSNSSTSILVEWDQPRQEVLYGILRGFRIRYCVAINTNITNATELIPAQQLYYILQNLEKFTNYSVEVTAVTVGEGPYSTPIIVVTDQDKPGEVPRPPSVDEGDLGSFSAVVRWNPPVDRNGIILSYTVNYVAISSISLRDRGHHRKQMNGVRLECILGGQMNINRNMTVDGTQTTATLTGLTPSTVYEFRVLAETAVGGGPFSASRSFTTSESVPAEPHELTVMYLNSTALEITWEHPRCDYGIREGYTVTHDPLPTVLDPPGAQGMPGSPHNLAAGNTQLIITDLTPNTNYNITVCAFTSVGCGPLSSRVNQTDEDAPQAVTNLAITSSRNTNNNKTVTIQITWTPPSRRNGSFNYMLRYSADQAPPYPQQRRQSTSQSPVMVDGSQQEHVVPSGLPYAEYRVMIYAFNIKRGVQGPSETAANRSLAIEPTSVTSLMAVATSNQSIRVSWDLPTYPNGPIQYYTLFYRPSDSPQQPPNIRNDGYVQVLVLDTNFEITGLMKYTHYTIHVRAIGQGSLLGAIDREILQQTNSTTQSIVTPSGPTEEPTSSTINILLPSPSQVQSGLVIFYAVVVVRSETPAANQAVYNDAGPYTNGANYYIAAAWARENISRVPESCTAGDGSTTVANTVVYRNAKLRSDTTYAIFIRIDIESDTGNVPHRTYSDYVISKTGSSTSFFQLLLVGDFKCGEWMRNKVEEKGNHIIAAVVDSTEQLCHCGFTAQNIDHTINEFQCFSSQHNQIVFRSRLYGTTTTNASTITNYISQWASNNMSIAVLDWILYVDSMCPVRISSLSDPMCTATTSPPPGTDSNMVSPTHLSTGDIVAGVVVVVVVVVVVIAITVTVVLIVVVIRRRRTSYGLRNLQIGGDKLKMMECPAYENYKQATSEDHTYEHIPFWPEDYSDPHQKEDHPAADPNMLYDKPLSCSDYEQPIPCSQ